MNKRSKAHPMPPGLNVRERDFVKCASVDFEQLVVQDARVFKAGNSLAIRIPSAIAKRIGLEDGTPVEMVVDRSTIYVRKAASPALEELNDGITADNTHEPVFENAIGAERW